MCKFGLFSVATLVKLLFSLPVFDRDNLVLNSPHQFRDINISFAKHNQGRKSRRVLFNREVTLMLLGFHLDYWEEYLDM